MKKILKLSLTFLLVMSSIVINPTMDFVSTIQADTKAEANPESVYYNDFSETTGNWIDYKSKMQRSVADGKMKIRNSGESIMLNKDDALRSSGDIEMTFEHKQNNRCFGLVFRADETSSADWQVAAYVASQDGSGPEWSVGQPGGKWNSYPATKLVAGQKYRMLVRYHETNVTIYLNGEEVLNEEIEYGGGKGSINGDWVGRVGIRKHCADQDFELERFVSGPLGSIPTTGFLDLKEDLYFNDFEQNYDGFKNYRGTTSMSVSDGKFNLVNQDQEALILNENDAKRSEGALEVDFTHSAGMRCMGPIFRADEANSGTGWQTVAYVEDNGGNPSWSVGQPGGKWNTYPISGKLEAGKDYKLLVKYQGINVKVYLNGVLQFDEDINYSNGTSINGEWTGQTGIRKYCVSQTYSLNRFISADYDAIPDEGFHEMIIPRLDQTGPVEPGEPEESAENLAFYKAMRDMWRDQKTGGFTDEDLQDEHVANYISNLNEDAKTLFDSVTFGAKGVWDKKSSDTNSANITTQYEKLNTMVKAYKTYGSDYFEDPEIYDFIVKALDYLTKPGWFDGVKVTGNWWNFSVGIPQEFADILIILSETLPKEDIKRYAQILSNYVPNAEKQIAGTGDNNYINISFASTATGANRTDLALSYLASGILLEKEAIVSDVAPSIESVIRIVKSGDGFYQDGSYVQHGDIPYTGSYGNVAIKGVGKILTILEGTPWQMSDEKIDTFSKLVSDSFIPVLYKGETMPMVGGRSISRAPGARKKGFGSATIFNLLIVSNFASEPYKTKLKETAKYWILQDDTEYYFNNNRDLRDLIEVKKVLNDGSVSGETIPFSGSKLFGSMDRFVHTNENYSLGLSMYSNRISAYEAGNGENKRGWFTSDGMIYLQNGDKSFGESYWPTVDFRRLPGTTVDLRPLVDETSGFSKQRSSESFVGGSTDGDNASIAMTLNKTGFKNSGTTPGLDLKAHKSWFFTEDAIFALGSDIQGTSPTAIETIVENRLLDPKMNYELKSNTSTEGNMSVTKGDWFMLEADDVANNIAYVFLDDHNIRIEKELRQGKYQDINNAFVNDKTYEETYQKIIIEHDKTVVDGSYAYVILPGVSQADLEAFIASDYEILSNTKDTQAVRKGNVLLANVFNTNGGSFSDISVNAPASFTIVEDSNTLTLNVSNPRHSDTKLKVNVKRDYLELSEDAITSDVEGITFEIATKGSAGKSHEVVLNKLVNKTELKTVIETMSNLDRTTMTAFYQELYDEKLSDLNAMDADDEAEQSDVDALIIEIQTFITTIQYKLELTNAQYAYDYAITLVVEDYTEATWNSVKTVMEELNAMIISYDETQALSFTQAELDALSVKLQQAIHDLELAEALTPSPNPEIDDLEQIIELFDELKEEDYTSQTYQAVKLKVDEAIALLATNAYTQEEINAMVDQLIELMDALIEAGSEAALDLSQINRLIDQFETLDKDMYTKESYDALNTLVQKARELLTETGISQTDINESVDAINGAFQALVLKEGVNEVDYSQLEARIKRFNDLDANHYTESSYRNLSDAITEAQRVIAENTSTQAAIDALIISLDQLFDSLETQTLTEDLDYSELEALIAKFEALEKERYTEASYNQLKDRIAKAQTLIDTGASTQAEIDSLVIEVNNYFAFLVAVNPDVKETINYANLIARFARFENLDKNAYTSDSYGVLDTKIKEARLLVNAEDTSQEDVDSMVRQIDSLFNQLVKKAESKIPEKEVSPKENQLPGSGISPSYTLLIGTILLLSGLIIYRKRKEV